jgi:hypothetical protein
VISLVVVFLSVPGCSQQTRTPQMADTQQDTAAQGGTAYVVFNNGSGGGSPLVPGIVIADALDDAIARTKAADGQVSEAASGGYVLAGRDLYVTINMGATTPSQSSASTGTQTVNPNQQPEASTAADIAAGGQVAADQGATSGQGSGTVSSEKQSRLDQQIAEVQAAASKLEAFQALLEQFFGQEAEGETESVED